MLWTQIAERIGIPSPIMEQLLNCEKTFDREAFRADIARLSDPLCAEAAYRALAEKLQPDEGTVKIELCELMASELMWDKYAALGIDERVFFDTMAAFTRFINETRVYSGAWAIDRTWWSYRQSGMLIFRIGALEYELKHAAGTVSIHIPSDADFSPESVTGSISDARAFIARFFPAFANAPITCHSWLLSDRITPFLKEGSNILAFQKRFDIRKYDHEGDCTTFLFQMPNGTPAEQLREDTSLQRSVKQLMLSGLHVGAGEGVLRLSPLD